MYYRISSIPIIVASLIVLQFIASCGSDKGTPPNTDVPTTFILVPGDYPTISEAIDSASQFDTIVVSDGVYRETISFHDKALTLASEYLVDGDRSHIAATIINGAPDEANGVDSGSVVTFNADNGNPSVLMGMTITGGVGTPYRGPAQPVNRCGGGVLCIDASPTITHCVISENTAEHGGGMYIAGSGRPTVSNCTFEKNEATAAGSIPIGAGGGAICIVARCALDNCGFRENSSANYGGALSLHYPTLDPTSIETCRFVANTAALNGGAIFATLTPMAVSNCVFDSNRANEGGAVSSFGGTTGNCTYRDCRFAANSSVTDGGAFYALSPKDSVIGCVFYENVSGADGAAGYWWASEGVVLQSCTFVGNSTLSSGKSALKVDGTMSLDRCIIAFNSSCRAAPTGAAFTMIECTDIYGNEEGDWIGPALGYFAGVNDNFSLDPLFCDKPNHDYRLSASSPCAPANSGCGELVGAQSVGCQ